MKNQKGITLIALVVSIIVMLILVVVTIQLIFDGGLIEKTQEAAQKTTQEMENEINEANEAGYNIDKAVYGSLYYLNPNPPVIDAENMTGVVFENNSLLVAYTADVSGSDKGGIIVDGIRVPTLMVMNENRRTEYGEYDIVEQTIYVYFYEPAIEKVMSSDLGMISEWGAQTVDTGWYKSTATVKEYEEGSSETDTVTVNTFEEITDLSIVKVALGEEENISSLFFGEGTFENMSLFVSPTPYEEVV